MAGSRPHALFQPKKPKNFFEISENTEFKLPGGYVSSVCQLNENQLVILTRRNKYKDHFIEIFDLQKKESIFTKAVSDHVFDLNQLSNGKILCSGSWEKYIFDPVSKELSKNLKEEGDFVGMLNEKEFVLSRKDGFSIINLDGKTPPIKKTLEWYDSCQIWPDETIAVKSLYLELYHREGDDVICSERIDMDAHKESFRVGENLIVRCHHYRDKEETDKSGQPKSKLLFKCMAKTEDEWKEVAGRECTSTHWLDWTMKFRKIPGDQMFMLESFDEIVFFDSKTFQRFDVETDFGDSELYGTDPNDESDRDSDAEDEEEPWYYHDTVSVLANGQVALGYNGYFRLITVKQVKELKDEKELKKEKELADCHPERQRMSA